MKSKLNTQVMYVLSRDEIIQFAKPLGLDETGTMAICYWNGEKLLEKTKEAFSGEKIDQDTYSKLIGILGDNYLSI